MIPLRTALFSFLCLAIVTHCRAEDNSFINARFDTHENPEVSLLVTSDNTDVSRLINLGLHECLYGYHEAAYNHFSDALREDPACVLGHIGMLMIHPLKSETYRKHLKELNECLNQSILTPVEEWYVSTFLQYLNGDLVGAAAAFKERAQIYRRDNMAACWDIILNHAAGEQGEDIRVRARNLSRRLPQTPLAFYALALLEEKASKPTQESLDAILKAVELSARSPHPYLCQLAGHLLAHSSRPKDAAAHFQTAMKHSHSSSEIYQSARLYHICTLIQSGGESEWMQALKEAHKLSQEAPHSAPVTDAETLQYWEGRTHLLRMLVLQPKPPAGAAINLASKSCNAAEGSPLKLYQDCLVASIRARSLAESGRVTTATTTFSQAERLYQRLQQEEYDFVQRGGLSKICFQRALRACMGAMYRAKIALYKDSVTIWQPHLNQVLNFPEPRFLPPVLPQSESSPKS